MIRRPFLIALLALGTVGGFASGFASMACHSHARRDAFERHVASVCIDAARRSHDVGDDARDGWRNDRDRGRDHDRE